MHKHPQSIYHSSLYICVKNVHKWTGKIGNNEPTTQRKHDSKQQCFETE